MSLNDEKVENEKIESEKIENEKINPPEEGEKSINHSEEIEDWENLEQKKREVNEFNAENNSAQNQIFIQDLGTGGFTVNYYTQKMESVVPPLPVEKKYNLRRQNECIEFVETFKNTEYFITAVVLCGLEAVVLADLSDLKSRIKSLLPEETIYDQEGNIVSAWKNNPYLALNSILAVIGGKKFFTEDGKQCVTLGENSLRALTHMLEQFPALQDVLLKFYLQLTRERKYQDFFYDIQISTGLAEFISLNFIDMEHPKFTDLYNNPNNDNLLGILIYKLYIEKSMEDEVVFIVKQWLFADRSWLWRSACLAYAYFLEHGSPFPLERELKKALVSRILFFKRNEARFFSILVVQSKYFRTFLCDVFSEAYQQAKNTETKKGLANLYVYLVRYNYYWVKESFVELPLVACDSQKQQEDLSNIVFSVMMDYRLRKQLYAVLKVYLKEISYYKYSEKVVHHIAAFFYNMSLAGEEYEEDIIDLLQQFPGRTAKQVVALLNKVI